MRFLLLRLEISLLILHFALTYDRFRYETLVDQVFNAIAAHDERFRLIIETENIALTVTNKAQQTLAHIAAKSNNFAALQYLLEREPSLLERTDSNHCTVLHLATIAGSLEAVKYLVEQHGANICHMSGRVRDRTAVHAAVEFNHLHILKYYVEDCNIDFNKPHAEQLIPPIFLAVRNRNWEVIQYLVEEKNANMKMLKNNGENILFVIVREDFLGLMRYLIDERKIDFNVNWKNNHGETPLHVAAILERMSILEYLVEGKSANVNAQKKTDKRTPLHYAASRDHVRACHFLIDHGADASIRDWYGEIAADKASDQGLIAYLENAAARSSRRSS